MKTMDLVGPLMNVNGVIVVVVELPLTPEDDLRISRATRGRHTC